MTLKHQKLIKEKLYKKSLMVQGHLRLLAEMMMIDFSFMLNRNLRLSIIFITILFTFYSCSNDKEDKEIEFINLRIIKVKGVGASHRDTVTVSKLKSLKELRREYFSDLEELTDVFKLPTPNYDLIFYTNDTSGDGYKYSIWENRILDSEGNVFETKKGIVSYIDNLYAESLSDE